MYFMDLKLIAPLKRLNLIVETYPVWCKIVDFSYTVFELIDCVKRKTFKLLIDRYRSLARFVD